MISASIFHVHNRHTRRSGVEQSLATFRFTQTDFSQSRPATTGRASPQASTSSIMESPSQRHTQQDSQSSRNTNLYNNTSTSLAAASRLSFLFSPQNPHYDDGRFQQPQSPTITPTTTPIELDDLDSFGRKLPTTGTSTPALLNTEDPPEPGHSNSATTPATASPTWEIYTTSPAKGAFPRSRIGR